MRSLSIYGLIGALFGLWVFQVLAGIAMPAYHDYLMPLAMYRDVTAISPLAASFGVVQWLALGALFLVACLWLMVAPRLNPVFAPLPQAKGKRRWAWAAWIGGGLLFLVGCICVSAATDMSSVVGGSESGVTHWIVAAAAFALAWVLVSPQAFGRFANKRSSKKLSWSVVARTAGLGALFALTFGLIVQAASAAFMIWFTVVTEALDRSMEQSVFGWTCLALGMMTLMALAFAIAFGLLPAFVPGTSKWRARISAARPALFLAAGALVACVLALPWLYSIDYLGSAKLVDAAELSKIEPLSLRLVKFCGDANCRVRKDASAPLKAAAPITQVSASGWLYAGGDVPLHPDSVTALEQFVIGKGKNSILRKSAMLGAADIHKTLWQPREYYELSDRFTQQGSMKHGSLLQTQIRLAWLMRAAPINAETRATLEQLSDDKRYFIGGRAAARLAATWARFGDMKRAESFLAVARERSPGRYEDVTLVPNTLSKGRLAGQIAIPGATPDGIRVGIFRVTNEEPTSPAASTKQEKSPRDRKPAFTNTNITMLSGSALLTTDGRFAFEDLSAGDYYLAVLVPNEKLKGKDSIVGSNAPDLITLNSRAPHRDLGVIRLASP